MILWALQISLFSSLVTNIIGETFQLPCGLCSYWVLDSSKEQFTCGLFFIRNLTRLEGYKNVALLTKDSWINSICLRHILPLLLAQMDQCCLLIHAAYLPLDDPNDPQNDPGSIVALDTNSL